MMTKRRRLAQKVSPKWNILNLYWGFFTAQLKSLAMVRKLKHHEQKLLRKVDFTTYASDNHHRDAAVIRRYAIQKPSDYEKYNRICGVRILFQKV
jgi:hypothetical protein